MKKTISVSIGGYAFILEEDAYRKLEQYLDRVRLNLGSSSDVREIMDDVEVRIAELFKQLMKDDGKEVVEMLMVDKTIGIMGAPEDFNLGTESNGPQPETEQPNYDRNNDKRSLFRDPDDQMLGGVCSGLAHYLGWDPLAVRLIFVLLILGLGTGILLYIVLWILVPAAETTSEKLRMHGEPVTLDSIKSRFEEFGEEVKEWGKNQKRAKKKWKRAGRQFGHRVEDTVHEMGHIIGRILGVVFLVAGVTLFVFLVNHFFTGRLSINQEDHFLMLIRNDPSVLFERSSDYMLLYTGAVTLLVLFMWSIVKGGLKLLFNLKLKNRMVNTATGIVSFLAIGAIIYSGVRLGSEFSQDESVVQRIPAIAQSDTLTIQVKHDRWFSDKLMADDAGYNELIKQSGRTLVFGYPEVEIRRCETGSTRVEIEKSAHGPRRMEAIRHAENIHYPVELRGDTIIFPAVFTAPLGDKLRAQDIKVRIYVNDSVRVNIHPGAFRVLRLEHSDLDEAEWEGAPYSVETFMMYPGGLRAVTRK